MTITQVSITNLKPPAVHGPLLLAGLQPIEVSHDASTLDQAVAGAAKKLKDMLDSTRGRLGSR